jgi:autotransporter strand-loop-strand O-heptosyltransferase
MFKKVIGHCSFVGHSGYAEHSREFFTALNKFLPCKIHNYAYCEDLSYLTIEQRDMLILKEDGNHSWGNDLFPQSTNQEILNIVLLETNHYYFYHEYKSPVIFYNVWELPKYPQGFFNKLKECDRLWLPTKCHKKWSIDQGYNPDKIDVIHEGVRGDIFKPGKEYNGKFRYIFAGRWDSRKNVANVIKAFLNVFKNNNDVELWLSSDNPFSVDGMENTNQRLKYYGLENKKIRVVHFPPFDKYVKTLQGGHVFLSASTCEGWHLPLIQAIASGTPSICTNYGPPLEFAKGIAHTVKVEKFEKPTNMFNTDVSEDLGTWAIPDNNDLERVIKDVYDNYKEYKKEALEHSRIIRDKFSWQNAAEKAYNIIKDINIFKNISELPSLSFLRYTEDDLGILFKSNINSKLNVISYVIDGYTGLTSYRMKMVLEPGINYFLKGPKNIKYMNFVIYDEFEKVVLLKVEKTHGNIDIRDRDKLGKLENYKIVNNKQGGIALPLYEIFVDKIPEKEASCRIHNGDIVFDIGGSIGLFSYYAVGKKAKEVHYFEPLKESYDSALYNLKNLGNIRFNNIAVGKAENNVDFFVPETGSIASSMYIEEGKKIKVNSINIMDYIVENNIEKIDFLKLDCEGSEYDIFDSMPDNYLSNNVKKIFMEFHFNKNNILREKILNKLDKCGFIYRFESGRNEKNELGILYAWKSFVKEFDFDSFIKPYENDLKRTGESRYNFYRYVIPKLIAKQKPLYVIETGTMWVDLKDNMGAFTLIFSDLIKNWSGGKLITIDISKEHMDNCKELTKEFFDVIEYVNSDSITYLRSLSNDKVKKIDLFYFDSFDLNLTDPEPSQQHHLNELLSVHNRVSDNVVISVDDNFLPGCWVEWKWYDNDGNIMSTEIVKTGDKIIGKGTLINEFLLEKGWERKTDIESFPGSNVFLYEKPYRKSYNEVKGVLENFYSDKTTQKIKRKPFQNIDVLVSEIGLGDTTIITPFSKYLCIHSNSEHFSTLTTFNDHYKTCDSFDNSCSTPEISKNDWGGGHAIQRIERALNLEVSVKPKGHLNIEKKIVKNKVAVHLNKGGAKHTNLSQKSENLVNRFMEKYFDIYEFVEINPKNTLTKTIEMLSTCEYFIGLNSGPMHLATALDLKCVVLVNSPLPSELFLPKIKECEIPELEWLYPQNVHLHENGSNKLVPKLTIRSLKNAFEGRVYPYWKEDFLNIGINQKLVYQDKELYQDQWVNSKVIKADFTVNVSLEKNKVEFTYNGITTTFRTVIFDLDTNLPIYSNEWELVSNSQYWMSPVAELKTLSGVRFCVYVFDGQEEWDDGILIYDYKERFQKVERDNLEIAKRIKTNIGDGSTYGVYKEIILEECYVYPECSVEEGDVVLDIGANVGIFALHALDKGASKVYCYEPVRKTYEYLSETLDGLENVELFNLAVSDSKGIDTIYKHFDLSSHAIRSGGASIFKHHESSIEEKVNCITLREAIEKIGHVNFLKIDIEAKEGDIFTSLEDGTLKNVDKIAMEIHHNQPLDKIKKILESEGFGVLRYVMQNRVLFANKVGGAKHENITIDNYFIDGAYLKINGESNKDYSVTFKDGEGNHIHSTILGAGWHIRSHRKYYTDWNIEASNGEKIVYQHKMDLKDKRVLISLDSKSLGDNLCWAPYIEKFRKKYKCEVFCSTFWNNILDYPKLSFIEPGSPYTNIYAGYNIGCFDNDNNRNKNHWQTIPLQQIASDYLGLEYKEIRPRLKNVGTKMDMKVKLPKKYVVIAPHSTAAMKYWQNSKWNEIILYLKKIGYDVISLSKEPNELNNVTYVTNSSIEDAIRVIKRSKFVLGISNGLLWLAWALNKPVVMVSGFTQPWCEFQEGCYRVYPKAGCRGKLNDPSIPFIRDDWNYCYNSNVLGGKRFECAENILTLDVIKAINLLIKENF